MQRDPTADVIPFPARLRTGKIARVAETLIGSTPKASAYYWRQTIAAMLRQMERAGLGADTINGEIETFTDAVRVEIVRRTRGQTIHILADGEIA